MSLKIFNLIAKPELNIFQRERHHIIFSLEENPIPVKQSHDLIRVLLEDEALQIMIRVKILCYKQKGLKPYD